jgi:hypothetical protein
MGKDIGTREKSYILEERLRRVFQGVLRRTREVRHNL